MAAEAVLGGAGVRGVVAGLAFGAVEGGGLADGVLVGVVASAASDAAGLVAAAFDEAEGLETDVERVAGGAGGCETVAGGAEFDLGAGGEFGGGGDGGAGGGVGVGAGVAAVAGDAGLDNCDAGAGGEAGVAVEAGPDGFGRLGDAEGGGGGAGGAGGVAEGEVEAIGAGVVADAVFEPAAVEGDEGGDALVAGAEDPIDTAFGGFGAAVGADGEAAAGLRIGEKEAAAGFAEG